MEKITALYYINIGGVDEDSKNKKIQSIENLLLNNDDNIKFNVIPTKTQTRIEWIIPDHYSSEDFEKLKLISIKYNNENNIEI